MKKCQCQWQEETEEFRSCRMENGKSRPLALTLALALTIVDGVQCVG
jgi:hypothetical protein